jgi:hypothetical protein
MILATFFVIEVVVCISLTNVLDFWVATQMAIYYTYVLEVVIHFCFLLDQLMAAPANVNFHINICTPI